MASPDCYCAVVSLRNCGEISCSGNAGASQCAPAPTGAGLAQEGDHHVKKGFPAKITPGDMMGADAPIPPLRQVPPPPRDAPAAASIPWFPGNRTCPAVPYRGPETGSPPNIQYLQDFHASGANSRLCAFLQSKKEITHGSRRADNPAATPTPCPPGRASRHYRSVPGQNICRPRAPQGAGSHGR